MSGEFVAAMEDVLELYAEADDPKRPRVNFDECSVELHADAQEPLPVAPGQPARVDYEYVRNGTANLFVIVDPNAGQRHVTVTERRTKLDFAEQMKYLCDELYPDADVVRVVLDNLNTHTMGSLYEAFPAAAARRLASKLEFHYTPVHASWLNMAELELRVCSGRFLGFFGVAERELGFLIGETVEHQLRHRDPHHRLTR